MQLVLFLLFSLGALVLFGLWNSQHWTSRQAYRFNNSELSGKLRVVFENGNISPAISRQFYRLGISVRPRYVVVGEDGWMYLGDQFEQVASRATRGMPELDQQLLAHWTTQLLKRQEWLASRGIVSVFAIAPNKHAIYPEHSPDWLPFSDQGTLTKLTAAAVAAGVNIVDAAPAIRLLKREQDWLYNRNDTHWTAPAAFAGYQEILNSLGADVVSLSPRDVMFEFQQQEEGGLSRLLGFASLYDASNDPDQRAIIHRQADGFCRSSINLQLKYTETCTPMKDVRVLARSRRVEQVDNKNALNDLSLLLVQDSFGLAPSRYFQHSFSRVWHAHQGYMRDVERLKNFVERFKPDVVIFMSVERNVLRPTVYQFDGAGVAIEAPVD